MINDPKPARNFLTKTHDLATARINIESERCQATRGPFRYTHILYGKSCVVLVKSHELCAGKLVGTSRKRFSYMFYIGIFQCAVEIFCPLFKSPNAEIEKIIRDRIW